jgi:hypothetical protein
MAAHPDECEPIVLFGLLRQREKAEGIVFSAEDVLRLGPGFVLRVNSKRHAAQLVFVPLTVFQTRHPPASKIQWLACSATR